MTARTNTSTGRPLSRRRFLGLTGGTAAAAALASACGSGSSSSQVQYWRAFTSNDLQRYFQQKTLSAYNAKNDPKVQLVVKQVDTMDRLQRTAVASGRGPDIITCDGPAQALSYVDSGNLLPLDEYAEKFDWKSFMLPWALETGRIKGKLYAVPNSYETMMLFYNPATFEKNGWEVPKTRDDFEGICTEAKGKGIMPLAVGEADWHATTEWFVTVFLNSFSGPEAVRQALLGKVSWTDAVFVDAITLLNSYFQKGWFGGGVQAYFTNKRAPLDTKLAGGQAAMDISGSWVTAEYAPFFGKKAGNDARWEWAPIPSFSSHAPYAVYTLSVGGTWSVNKDSKAAAGAAKFLDFLASDPKRQTRALADVAQEPCPIKLPASAFPADIDERLKSMYVSLAAAKDVGYTTWTFWPPKSDTYVYESMDKVITGKMTPKQYCAGLDQVFKPELKAGLVPPLPEV